MQKQYISITEIEPYVRWTGRMFFPKGEQTPLRGAFDSRLFYLLEGEADITVCSDPDVRTVHGMLPSDAVMIAPGHPYIIRAAEDTVLLVINFDFLRHEGQGPLPLPMALPEHLCAEQTTEALSFPDGFLETGSALVCSFHAVLPVLEAMVAEYDSASAYFEEQTGTLCAYCLRAFFRQSVSRIPAQGRTGVTEILSYISAHYLEDISNRSIAGQFHYHPVYVNHLIRAQTGCSLHRYLSRLRMLHAADLLRSGNLPVSEVARMSGFSDFSYFSQYFKQTFGCTPSAYRNGLFSARPDAEEE